MTALLVVGIKESARFNNVIVVVKMAIVLLVIGFGFMYVNSDNWTPFVPAAEGPGKYGWSGIVRAAGVVFFAYIGFDAVSTAAQEAKNPQRDMPIGMLGSLAVCTLLYILMSLVMTGPGALPDAQRAAPGRRGRARAAGVAAVDRLPRRHRGDGRASRRWCW
jgi:APA family basic amino acid/polyamine antiporter